MKTIESNRLLDEPIELRATDSLDFGSGRDMPFTSDRLIVLSPEHEADIEAEVMAGLMVFGAMEQTLVMQRSGLPTAVARIDATIDPETNRIHSYEVEDRPGGMGVLHEMGKEVAGVTLGESIKGHFEETFGRLPVVKRHSETLGNDDGFVLPVEMFTDTKLKTRPDQPILVRANRKKMESHPRLADVTALSVAPILEEGKRQYRLRTGHAELVTSPSLLPEDDSIVLKGLQGTQCDSVLVKLSKADAKVHGNRDTGTLTKARSMVEENGAVLMERFVPGISVNMTGAQKMGSMILRVFCSVNQDGARVIGGAFLARPGHLVHGARDAVSGLVLPNREAA